MFSPPVTLPTILFQFSFPTKCSLWMVYTSSLNVTSGLHLCTCQCKGGEGTSRVSSWLQSVVPQGHAYPEKPLSGWLCCWLPLPVLSGTIPGSGRKLLAVSCHGKCPACAYSPLRVSLGMGRALGVEPTVLSGPAEAIVDPAHLPVTSLTSARWQSLGCLWFGRYCWTVSASGASEAQFQITGRDNATTETLIGWVSHTLFLPT